MLFNDKKLEELIEANKSTLENLGETLAELKKRLDVIDNSLEELHNATKDNTETIEEINKVIEINKNEDSSTRKEVEGIREILKGVEWITEKGKKEFFNYIFEKNEQEYNNYYMSNEIQWKTRVNDVPINLPNAKVGKIYETSFRIPKDIAIVKMVKTEDIKGLDFKYDENDGTCYIGGTPENAGEFSITIKYIYPGWVEGKPVLERSIPISINPDPKSLWKNIATPEDIDYFQPDFDSDYVKVGKKDGEPQKDIVVASIRGRSHAHKGTPRDDHFKVMHDDNGWYIMAVADGAGSAKYSRKGSAIACDTVVDICKEGVKDSSLEEAIRAFSEDRSDDKKKIIGDKLYNLLANAALKAGKAITDEAARKDTEVKAKVADTPNQNTPMCTITDHDYGTTLLLAICKKFSFGWFIASFWVGDGAICIYDKKRNYMKLMGIPDSGEQAGQTVFLTMKNVVFKDPVSIYNRLRFQIEEDFDALYLMSDGVSDPKFETEANLNNIKMWDALWDDLHGKNEDRCNVKLEDDNDESQYQLLKWLEFYKEGHHDDRTIAILY